MNSARAFGHLVLAILWMALSVADPAIAQVTTAIGVNQLLWDSFSRSDQATVLAQFKNLEITPSDSVGVIQSVQAVNRSTPGSNVGAAIGGALGQTMYIDRAFSGNNYSATKQLGAGLLGAAIGSTLDARPTILFVFNYAIRTSDGVLREFRVSSPDEFTRPVGQCVFVAGIRPAPESNCYTDKVQLLKHLSALAQSPASVVSVRAAVRPVNVKCNVPGVGMMTLEVSVCTQMEGTVVER